MLNFYRMKAVKSVNPDSTVQWDFGVLLTEGPWTFELGVTTECLLHYHAFQALVLCRLAKMYRFPAAEGRTLEVADMFWREFIAGELDDVHSEAPPRSPSPAPNTDKLN